MIKKDDWVRVAQKIGLEILKVKKENKKEYVFDQLRKRWVYLTPEEQIRQLLVIFLINQLKIKRQFIAIEKSFSIGNTIKRFDLAILDSNFKVLCLLETKKEVENIFSEKNKAQILNYQRVINSNAFGITNGTYTIGLKKNDADWNFKHTISDLVKH